MLATAISSKRPPTRTPSHDRVFTLDALGRCSQVFDLRRDITGLRCSTCSLKIQVLLDSSSLGSHTVQSRNPPVLEPCLAPAQPVNEGFNRFWQSEIRCFYHGSSVADLANALVGFHS